jgi:hypothetical protein
MLLHALRFDGLLMRPEWMDWRGLGVAAAGPLADLFDLHQDVRHWDVKDAI